MPTIRLAEPRDAAGVADIYDPIVASSPISFEVEPPGPAVLARRIEATLALAPWLVCQDAAGVAGYAYGGPHRDRAAYRWSADVSVYVRADRRRHGVGRALYRSLFALLRLQGYRAAHAGITLPNAGSVGLHEAIGFGLVGIYRKVGFKQGAWYDVGWWQLELAERQGHPSPILGMAELVAAGGFGEALAAGESLLGP